MSGIRSIRLFRFLCRRGLLLRDGQLDDAAGTQTLGAEVDEVLCILQRAGDTEPRNPGTITYGELCGETGTKLKACPACTPVQKRSELEEINARYAEGGDHDPDMTEALQSCPRKIR